MVLVLWGTLAQVHLGTYPAQRIFFDSFFVFRRFGSMRIPIFPGGLTLGLAWIVNLSAAYVGQVRRHLHKVGLLISHLGLILLLAGQFFTQVFSIESHLPIQIGESQNYSESSRAVELVLIDKSNRDFDEVTSIPSGKLKAGELSLPRLGLTLSVKKYFPNAVLSMKPELGPSEATRGVGAKVHVEEAPTVTQDDEENVPSALVEVKDAQGSLGTWWVSSALGAPQSFNSNGKDYEIYLRPRRYYFPFTITLKEFHHDIYPGTDIPKNFSSLVSLIDPEANVKRDNLIYMNHPLRYRGYTFYQASFGNNDQLSVFAVVQNPFAISPYLGCAMVLLGLAWHFLVSLTAFLRKRS